MVTSAPPVDRAQAVAAAMGTSVVQFKRHYAPVHREFLMQAGVAGAAGPGPNTTAAVAAEAAAAVAGSMSRLQMGNNDEEDIVILSSDLGEDDDYEGGEEW